MYPMCICNRIIYAGTYMFIIHILLMCFALVIYGGETAMHFNQSKHWCNRCNARIGQCTCNDSCYIPYPIVGPTGPAGATGPAGDTGPAGPAGNIGPAGRCNRRYRSCWRPHRCYRADRAHGCNRYRGADRADRPHRDRGISGLRHLYFDYAPGHLGRRAGRFRQCTKHQRGFGLHGRRFRGNRIGCRRL